MLCLLVLLPVLQAQSEKNQPAAQSADQPNPYRLSPELNDALRDGFQLYFKHQYAEAKSRLEAALTLARDQKSAWGEGEAHRLLGLIALDAANYPLSQSELDQALTLFESVRSSERAARVHQHMGAVANYMGKPDQAIAHYQTALSEFEAIHDLESQALTIQNLSLVETLPHNERRAYLERGLGLARQLGERVLVGRFLHSIGDDLFMQGDYAGAIEKLNEAAAAFEEGGDQLGLAFVWTSLGRLYRSHGAYAEAIEAYKKGLKIQEETADKMGVIQSLNAMAISYGDSGQYSLARETYERALRLARETGSPRVLAFMAGNVGCTYVDNAVTAQRGIALLEESLHLDPDSIWVANRYLCLAGAYESLKQYDRALEADNKAVDIARDKSNLDYRSQTLQKRAHLYRDLKRYSEALADIQAAIGLLEELRAKLVPADFLKQGYSNNIQEYFEDAVDLHETLGQHQEAMVVAEQARARAFLDLLATRDSGKEKAQAPESVAASENPQSTSSSGDVTANDKKPAAPAMIATRGSAFAQFGAPNEAPVLSSEASVAAPTFDELVSIAKRLDSTLLSFWVNPEETFVWVLKPDGTVRSERVVVRADQIGRLVRATSYGGDETASPEATSAEAKSSSNGPALTATRGAHTVRLRGGGELVIGSKPSEAWRDLYKLLILPVKDSLPPAGSRLTIVPHGQLFRLSFAALQDQQGRYLVEDYALNYAPSLGVLRLTGERKQKLGKREPRYLIFADPQIAPSTVKNADLPPLPGAREEARNLSRLLPREETSVLIGADASKRALVEQSFGKTVLHLATHAIVSDDRPWDSFLALSATDKSPPGEGRLSAQEIYGLRLQTDLVVLSACRTALGKVSGDGMAGLTRAFFYGGAPSVMATLWDVADEPTSLLVSDFYKSLLKDPDKSLALRAAQLRLIRTLREHRVKVKTPLGPVTLPEDPVFWAGFVLQGEP